MEETESEVSSLRSSLEAGLTGLLHPIRTVSEHGGYSQRTKFSQGKLQSIGDTL